MTCYAVTVDKKTEEVMATTEITQEQLDQWRKNAEGMTHLSIVESDSWSTEINVYSKTLTNKKAEWPKRYVKQDGSVYDLVKVHPQVYKQNSYDNIEGFTGHAVYRPNGKITTEEE